jgi:hypothetical protein
VPLPVPWCAPSGRFVQQSSKWSAGARRRCAAARLLQRFSSPGRCSSAGSAQSGPGCYLQASENAARQHGTATLQQADAWTHSGCRWRAPASWCRCCCSRRATRASATAPTTGCTPAGRRPQRRWQPGPGSPRSAGSAARGEGAGAGHVSMRSEKRGKRREKRAGEKNKESTGLVAARQQAWRGAQARGSRNTPLGGAPRAQPVLRLQACAALCAAGRRTDWICSAFCWQAELCRVRAEACVGLVRNAQARASARHASLRPAAPPRAPAAACKATQPQCIGVCACALTRAARK